jgi:hypothetical protein
MFEEKFSNKKIEKTTKNTIDKESYYFIKNQLLLNKYIEKQKINKNKLFKNLFNKIKREKYLLRNKVIKQNIIILKAKSK